MVSPIALQKARVRTDEPVDFEMCRRFRFLISTGLKTRARHEQDVQQAKWFPESLREREKEIGVTADGRNRQPIGSRGAFALPPVRVMVRVLVSRLIQSAEFPA